MEPFLFFCMCWQEWFWCGTVQLITVGVLIRCCSLSGTHGAESVLHPVRLHRETINHQNDSETEKGGREEDRRDVEAEWRKNGGRGGSCENRGMSEKRRLGGKKHMMWEKKKRLCPCIALKFWRRMTIQWVQLDYSPPWKVRTHVEAKATSKLVMSDV